MGPEQEDAIIATQVNAHLKHGIWMAALSASEAATPELRETFALLCQDAIRRQAALVRLMKQRGWYVPPPVSRDLIETLLPQLQLLTSGPLAATSRT